jgi:predicted phosphodiesterase
MSTYTDEQLKFILDNKEKYTWEKLADKYNQFFEDEKTPNALRKTYKRFQDYEFSQEEMVTNIRRAHLATKGKSIVAKENKALVEHLASRDSLIDEIKDLIKTIRFTKPKTIRVKKDRKKKNMTMEVMLSDLHYGKLTKKFNGDRAREMAKQMGQVVLAEIERYSKFYNVEKVVTIFGGDMIENSDFHGVESRMASEYGNSEQVRICLESLFQDYIAPIASSGRELHFVCVTGNHDRTGMKSTYQDPGKENLTWIVYRTLELMCKTVKIKAKFDIPDGVYATYNVYGNTVLVEHGDHIKGGMTRNACESHMAKRSKQVGGLIDYMRLGHFHEPTMYGRGRVIVNGSFPGQDGYSEINGYNSESVQMINYYIESESRPTSYYHSFPVYLE